MASPHPFANFVGRRAQLAEARALLGSHRLVTITGIGGAGKTRLAIELTEGLARSVAGRLFFVPLAAVESPDLAPMAIANALRVGEAGGPDLEAALVAELSGTPTLLVLDNCEHLLPGLATWVAELLAGCPSLRVLATSRERLGMPGEAVALLGPMTDTEAIELLQSRSSAAAPNLRVAPAAGDELLALCNSLDNLPLGIELAARRLGSISVIELTRRVQASVGALGAQAGVPLRHQSLEAALDWSYRLLPPRGRFAWRTLSVFPGSFTLKSAEAVIGEDAASVVDELVSRSILTYSPEGGGRYSMLQTVRQFGASHLTDEERVAVESTLTEEMMALAIEAEAALGGPGEDLGWLSRLDHEQANLRRALSLAVSAHAPAALRLAVALAQYWDVRGQLHEAAHWTAAALSVPPADAQVYAQLLDVAGWIAVRLGDYDRARALLKEAVAAAREAGESAVEARALSNLGLIQMITGDFDGARTLLEESLVVARAGQDTAVELGPLFVRALLNYFEGDHAGALADATTSVQLARARGNRKTLALFLGGLGNLLLETGDLKAARAHLTEALSICLEINDQVNLLLILGAWCRLLASEHRHEQVVQVADTLERLRASAKVAPIPIWQARVDEAVTVSRAALASRPGPARSPAPAAANPRAIAKLLDVTAPEVAATATMAANRLSKRELEVAELVAQGLGNQEIGRRLFIGTRTVETHVEHILQKLSLPNRLAVARWHDESRLG